MIEFRFLPDTTEDVRVSALRRVFRISDALAKRTAASAKWLRVKDGPYKAISALPGVFIETRKSGDVENLSWWIVQDAYATT